MGRPPKGEERRSVLIQVRVSRADAQKIVEEAERSGVSVSTWVYEIVKKKLKELGERNGEK